MVSCLISLRITPNGQALSRIFLHQGEHGDLETTEYALRCQMENRRLREIRASRRFDGHVHCRSNNAAHHPSLSDPAPSRSVCKQAERHRLPCGAAATHSIGNERGVTATSSLAGLVSRNGSTRLTSRRSRTARPARDWRRKVWLSPRPGTAGSWDRCPCAARSLRSSSCCPACSCRADRARR